MIDFSCLKLLTVDRIQQFCVLMLLELLSRCVWFSVILRDTALTFVEVLTTLSLSVEMNRSTSVVGWSSPSGTWKTVKRVVVTRLGGGGRKGGKRRLILQDYKAFCFIESSLPCWPEQQVVLGFKIRCQPLMSSTNPLTHYGSKSSMRIKRRCGQEEEM